ncbi:hypothetical protein V2J09_013109 [Rumex salicifolius]
MSNTENTTELSYWLNWRFLVCALIVLFSIVFALFLIWRYEGGRKRSKDGEEEPPCDKGGLLYEDEAWKTCVQWINPAWLLGFRLFSFILLLTLIIGNTVADGGFSIFGVLQYKFDSRNRNMDKGMYTAPLLQDDEGQFPQTADFWGYLLQIIYQLTRSKRESPECKSPPWVYALGGNFL